MVTIEKLNSVGEANNVVKSGAQYYGGGTLVMRAINYAEDGYDRIVYTNDALLKEIRIEGTQLHLGAGVTMAEIIRSNNIDWLHPVAKSVGGPAIRSAATVGGNLFAPHPYGDFATALLALDAVVMTGDDQSYPLEEFLAMRNGFSSIIQSIKCNVPDRGTFRFKKISRVKPKGISVMSIAACLPISAGRISNARITFGAMGPTPIRAKAAEQAFEGGSLDEGSIDRAIASLTNDLNPPNDPIASGWYRKEVAPVHLKRLLLERTV